MTNISKKTGEKMPEANEPTPGDQQLNMAEALKRPGIVGQPDVVPPRKRLTPEEKEARLKDLRTSLPHMQNMTTDIKTQKMLRFHPDFELQDGFHYRFCTSQEIAGFDKYNPSELQQVVPSGVTGGVYHTEMFGDPEDPHSPWKRNGIPYGKYTMRDSEMDFEQWLCVQTKGAMIAAQLNISSNAEKMISPDQGDLQGSVGKLAQFDPVTGQQLSSVERVKVVQSADWSGLSHKAN